MSVKQIDIAKAVGLDVSSCNKILNKVPGPRFRKETIARVFKVAREMGYNFHRQTKQSLQRRNEELKRENDELRRVVAELLGHKDRPSPERILQLKSLVEKIA